MIFCTGDCHAEFNKFSTKNFPEQKELSREDFVIVCGDFGIWHDTPKERYWLDWLNEKPFTTLFVDGNHENFDRLYGDEFPIVDFHGGKAHKVRDNIYHLMRGYVFDLCGKKFFAFGGASSHDIADGILDQADFDTEEAFESTYHRWWRQGRMFRVKHFSWWEEELPNQAEMDFGEQTLKANDYAVDYVISHCLPQDAAVLMGFCSADRLTMYFNKLLQDGLQFQAWYAGHYHVNKKIMSKFQVLYEDIVRVV